MKYHNIAEDILSGKVKIAVLKTLLRYPQKKFSGRELARILASSPSSVIEILELFGRYGLAYKSRIGKTTEWTINQRHLLADKITPLLNMDKEIYEILCRKIKAAFYKNKSVMKVIIFGSIARGEEKPGSDIDLFVLIKEEKSKKAIKHITDKLNELLIPVFGNAASIFVYSKRELKAKKNIALIKQIEKEGKVLINHG